MAINMELRVIAEGVETREQLNYLNEEGCHEIQGYYLSRPVSAHEVCSLVEADNKSRQDED